MTQKSWIYLTLAVAFFGWLVAVVLLYQLSYAAEERIRQVGPGGTASHVTLGKPMRFDPETGTYTEMGFVEAEAGPLFLLTLAFAGGALFVTRRIRRRGAEGLAGAPASLSLEALENELCAGSPRTRARAAKALGQMRHRAAIPALAVARTDQDPQVQQCAVDALDAIDPEWRKLPEARVATDYELAGLSELLMPMLDKAQGLVATAEKLIPLLELVEAKDPRALEALQEAMTDSDPIMRMRAAGAMGDLGDPGAVPALREALTDPDQSVQEKAEESLDILAPGWREDAESAASSDECLPTPTEEEAESSSTVSERWRDICKEEILRFLGTTRTREYEEQTGAWWSRDDLRLVVAKTYSADLEPDWLFSATEAAIDDLVGQGKLAGTDSGYRLRR